MMERNATRNETLKPETLESDSMLDMLESVSEWSPEPSPEPSTCEPARAIAGSL